jgi:hypothetical protein
MNSTMISREQMRKIYYENSQANIRKYLIIAAVGVAALVILLLVTLGGTPDQGPGTSTTFSVQEPDIDQQSDTIRSRLSSVVQELDNIIESQS